MRRGMSQMGQSRRIGDELGMTALPSAADVAGTGSQARPQPITSLGLFNDMFTFWDPILINQ